MIDLTEFLLKRIAEDETEACTFINEGPRRAWAAEDASGPRRDDEYAQLNIGAGRVLAECEAKRRIVKWVNDWPLRPSRPSSVDGVLEMLALPYADHPDYDEAWRP